VSLSAPFRFTSGYGFSDQRSRAIVSLDLFQRKERPMRHREKMQIGDTDGEETVSFSKGKRKMLDMRSRESQLEARAAPAFFARHFSRFARGCLEAFSPPARRRRASALATQHSDETERRWPATARRDAE
jgi:hypothetical protein